MFLSHTVVFHSLVPNTYLLIHQSQALSTPNSSCSLLYSSSKTPIPVSLSLPAILQFQAPGNPSSSFKSTLLAHMPFKSSSYLLHSQAPISSMSSATGPTGRTSSLQFKSLSVAIQRNSYSSPVWSMLSANRNFYVKYIKSLLSMSKLQFFKGQIWVDFPRGSKR